MPGYWPIAIIPRVILSRLGKLRLTMGQSITCTPGTSSIPPGTPATPESATITTAASVGLIGQCGQQQIPGYLAHIDTHLNGITHAPGATPGQVKLAAQINTENNQVNSLLAKTRQDAQQL